MALVWCQMETEPNKTIPLFIVPSFEGQGLKITQNLTHISFFISCEAQLILKDSLANTVFTECIHQTMNPPINHLDFCPRRLSEGQSRTPLKPIELLQREGPDVRNEGPHHCQTQTANSRTDAAAPTWHVRKTLHLPFHPASTHLSLSSPYMITTAQSWSAGSTQRYRITDKPISKHDQDGERGWCQDPGERMQHLCNWLGKIRDKAIQNIHIEQAPWDRDEICFTAKNCTKDSKERWRQWDEQVYWKQKKGKHATLWNGLRSFLCLLPEGLIADWCWW